MQQLTEGRQQRIADRVAMLVIDGFEVVEVQDRHGQRCAGAAGNRHLGRQHLVQVTAVVQPGQHVDRGLLAQRLLQRLHFGHLVRQLLVDGRQLDA